MVKKSFLWRKVSIGDTCQETTAILSKLNIQPTPDTCGRKTRLAERLLIVSTSAASTASASGGAGAAATDAEPGCTGQLSEVRPA